MICCTCRVHFYLAVLIALRLAASLHAQLDPGQNVVAHKSVLLWPNGAPEAKGSDLPDKPALTIHLPKQEKANGAAVVVNPGGGYRILASDHEGLQVARELNRQGVAAFVLRYRLMPKYDSSIALLDAQRAIRYVRKNAKQYGIDQNRIGMLGFSAGGHLAAAAGVNFDVQPATDEPIDQISSRPDFLVLVYPAISKELFKGRGWNYPSPDKKVTKKTPPAFLVHTHEDFLSPNHSIAFYQKLLENKVQAELHVFGRGPHGTGTAPGDPDLGKWPGLMNRWMCRNGFLTSQKRIALSGNVLVNDKPLFWGWLTLLPEDKTLPPVSVYMGWKAMGKFQLNSENGPCPGKYRAEVCMVASEFSKPQDGAYSQDDVIVISKSTDGTPLSVVISKESSEKPLQISVAK